MTTSLEVIVLKDNAFLVGVCVAIGSKHEVAALQPAARGKSREAESQLREQAIAGGGKVSTINSRILGVQRVIMSSKIVCGQHPDAANHFNPSYIGKSLDE